MANKYIKKCSTLLAIVKIKIKTTLRFHLILLRIAKIKETAAQKMLVRMYRKGNPHLLLVDYKLIHPIYVENPHKSKSKSTI